MYSFDEAVDNQDNMFGFDCKFFFFLNKFVMQEIERGTLRLWTFLRGHNYLTGCILPIDASVQLP